MKLESVRILHAQGVPDHYTANQVYQPIDEDHRRYGSFIILFEQANVQNGAFVASLINTLIREYYRQRTNDRLGCFEHTLVRMNEQIKQYAASLDSATELNLNGSIVLSLDNEIHITHIGSPLAYLRRAQSLIQLSESTAEDGESPTFSVITSGDVYEGDILVLISSLGQKEVLKDDLVFALQHTPLDESARAYARLLKQKFERSAEAVFIRFNNESEATSQVYVDKSLESRGEKVAEYKKTASQQLGFLKSGVEFLYDSARKRKGHQQTAKPQPVQEPSSSREDDLPDMAQATINGDEEAPVESVTEENRDLLDDIIPEESPEESSLEPLKTEESDGSFQVRTYERIIKVTPHTSAKAEYPPELVEEATSVVAQKTLKPAFKARTAYLLIGSLILLALIIRVANSLPLGKTSRADESVDVASLIAEAEGADRDATSAQVKGDTATAIDQDLIALEALGKIPSKQESEKSKTLKARVTESYLALAKSSILPKGTNSHTVPDSVQKLIATQNGTYALLQNKALYKYGDAGTVPVKNIPTGTTMIDGVAYDGGTKFALAASSPDGTPTLLSVDTATDEVKSVTRSDGKAWPTAHLLTSFEKNLYFVSASMWKGTPSGDSYRISEYVKGTSTDSLTSIANNGFAFYAIESSNQIVRIAANSPKTPIKIMGVPERFWPHQITRIISGPKESILYLLDTNGQRILQITTEGEYQKQFILPKDTTYTDCAATETNFICATSTKEIKTIAAQ